MVADAIYSLLTGSAAVTAVVGDRIYPGAVPQEEERPYLRYAMADDVPETLDGTLHAVTLAVGSWAGGYRASHDLANQVQAALSGQRGTIGTTVILGVAPQQKDEDYEPPWDAGDEREWMITMLFRVFYREL